MEVMLSTNKKTESIVLFTDGVGVEHLLSAVPKPKAIVGASDRPQYHDTLSNAALQTGATFLIQPSRRSSGYKDFYDSIKLLSPSHLICFCYSMKIHAEVLGLFEGRAANFHASLLPKNRGPNPIQWSLIRGERVTGLTMHQIVEAIDAGPILAQKVLPIGDDDTWVSLALKIDHETPEFITENVNRWLKDQLTPRSQITEDSTTNFRLTPDFPLIDFDKMTVIQIYNLIRAQVHPLAGAYFVSDGKEVRLPTKLSINEIAMLKEKLSKFTNTNIGDDS